MVLTSASLEVQLSNAAFDVEIFEAVHVHGRQVDDGLITDESSNDIGDGLLTLAVGNVDNLSGDQTREAEPSDEECSSWMIKLISMDQNVFHHGHAVLGRWEASKMEEKHTEEQDEVSISVSDEGELKSGVHKKYEEEEDLDDVDETASVEEV